MLAVGGTSCISLISVAAADENSLTPLHRLLPTETASRGFGGSPVGGGDKSSRFAFSAFPCGGWYHYPRRALHAAETLDARGSRRRIRRFYAAAEFALCGLNLPSSGTHATPAPNRAHSGSHAETRGESAERRMQGCKVFKSLHPYILAPVNTSTIARRIFLK